MRKQALYSQEIRTCDNVIKQVPLF